MALRRLLALALTFAGLLGTIDAQRRKLSGPLPTEYLSDVYDFWLANGRIVYREVGTGTSDYLALPLNGGTPPEVLELAAGFHRVELTPDGARLLLIGTDLRSLFSIPADGSGTRVQLNAPLGAGLRIRSHAVSEDSAFVVYEVGMEAGAGLAYSVRVDGSQPAVQLHAEGIGRYELTSDSSRVVFLSWENKLYTVPIAGGTPPVLVQAQPPRGVAEFALAPDASRVVYRCDAAELSVQELWSAPVDAAQPPVKLSAPLVAGGDVVRFHISRHSQHVTYVADQAVDGTNALYAVPITGGAVLELSAGVAGRAITEEQSSPDRTRMLYRANHDDASSQDLYTVPIDGSQPPVNLTAALPLAVQGFLFDPLSGRVVFRVYAAGGTYQLYSAPSDGSASAVRIDPPGATEGVQADFAIAVGSRVVFLSDPGTPERHQLYCAPVDGSAPALPLNSPLPPDGRVHSFVLDGARARALYRAEQNIDDVTELYLVGVDGSAPPLVRSTVHEHVSAIGGVERMVPTPDGTRALYSGQEVPGRGIYTVGLDGTPQSLLLALGVALEIRSTPDSQRVVYTTTALHSAPLDGSAPPVQIAGSPVSWSIAPDSSRVVLSRIVANYQPPTRIQSVPVAGGMALELNSPRAVTGEVFAPEISSNSSRVVYAGIQDAAGVTELYSVPLAGGAAPVRLSGSMVLGGDVVAAEWLGAPRISADSSRVVYRADRDVDECVELYSAPLAGGAPPTELSVLPAADRDVSSFAISPDSTRVVYVADQNADDRFELYSVPLAGGATPVELSALSGSDRDVDVYLPTYVGDPQPFLISPDSDWVVYRADQDVDDALDLYAVPLAGGAAPVRLTFDATQEAAHWLHAISADSRWVVYERRTSTRSDLYSVRIDGGAAPVRLNGELPVTRRFWYPVTELDPTGRWVLFHAAPVLPGMDELFVVPIHGRSAPRRVHAPLAVAAPTWIPGIFRPGHDALLYNVGELYINELVGSRTGPMVHR